MKMKSQRITLALLLVLSMVLGSAIMVFAAGSVPAAWDGSVANDFAGGNGSENNPFVIESAAQLALMQQLVNAQAGYLVDAEGNVIESAKIEAVTDATWFVPKGTEGNAAKLFGLFKYEGVDYFYNGNTGVAHKVSSYTTSSAYHFLIDGTNYYSVERPAKNKEGGSAIVYDVENFTYVDTGVALHNTNDATFYLLTDSSKTTNKSIRETVYTINLAEAVNGASTLYMATSANTHRAQVRDVEQVTVADTVYYRANVNASNFVAVTATVAGNQITVAKDGEVELEMHYYASASYRLAADIALNDISTVSQWTNSKNGPANKWISIGESKQAPFSGHFDGDGHTIYGLYQYQANGGYHTPNNFIDGNRYDPAMKVSPYSGLFGYANGATLENVVLGEGYIRSACVAGGLVAAAKDTNISNVTNNALNIKVDKGAYDYSDYWEAEAGGIVANLSGVSVLSGCTNNATVDCDNTSGTSGSGTLKSYVGGIVGRIRNSSHVGTYVFGSVNNGDIVGRASHANGSHTAFVGGIVGKVEYGRVSSSINAGYVKGTHNGLVAWTGGIVGHLNRGEISSCLNLAELTESVANGSGGTIRAGGIVGQIEGAKNDVAIVANCVNIATVKHNDGNGATTANAYAGLIAGYVNQHSKISNNYYVLPATESQTVVASQHASNVTVSNNFEITADHMKGTASSVISAESTYANTPSLVIALDSYIKASNKSYTMTFSQGANAPELYREYLQRTALNVTGTDKGSYSAMATADSVFPPETGVVAEGAVVGEIYRFSVSANAGYVLRNVELTVGNAAPVALAPDAEGGYSFVMPAESVVIALNFVPEGAGAHSIYYEGIDEVLSWSAYKPTAHFEGYTTTIPVPTRSGYVFAGWIVNGSGAAQMNLVLGANDYTSAITLTATWEAKKVVDINYGQQVPAYDGERNPFVISGADAALAGLKVEYFVDGAWTTSAPINAGKYDVRLTRAEDAVYQALDRVLTEALFIDRAASTVTILSNLDKVYNGEALTLPEISTIGDGTVSYHWFSGANELTSAPVDAGTYQMVVRISEGANYKAAESVLTVVVDRATIPAGSYSWDYTNAFEYNGSLQGVTVIGLPNHVSVSYTGTASAENAGVYTAGAVLTLNETNYYPISIDPITWEIKKATINAVDMHWNYSDAYYYNATVHSVAIVGIPANVEVVYNGTVEAKNVGVYTVSASFIFDDQNYNPITIEPLTWEVKKATLASLGLTWSNADFVYDSTEKTVTVLGLPADITISGYVGNVATNAGTYTAYATFSYDTNNYEEVSIEPLTWTIAKATYDMSGASWSEVLAFVYDGSAKNVILSGVPAGVAVSYENNVMTNAGAYTAVASFTVDPNYNEIAPMQVEWTIAKADATIQANAEYVFNFNGGPVTIPATLNHNETVIVTDPAELIQKGEYEVTLIAAATTNYNEASVTVKVIIVESDASMLNRVSIMIDNGIYSQSQVERLALLTEAYAVLAEVRDLTTDAAKEVLDNFGYLVYVYNTYAEDVNATMAQGEEAAMVLTEAYVYSPSVVAMLSDIKKKKWFE